MIYYSGEREEKNEGQKGMTMMAALVLVAALGSVSVLFGMVPLSNSNLSMTAGGPFPCSRQTQVGDFVVTGHDATCMTDDSTRRVTAVNAGASGTGARPAMPGMAPPGSAQDICKPGWFHKVTESDTLANTQIKTQSSNPAHVTIAEIPVCPGATGNPPVYWDTAGSRYQEWLKANRVQWTNMGTNGWADPGKLNAYCLKVNVPAPGGASTMEVWKPIENWCNPASGPGRVEYCKPSTAEWRGSNVEDFKTTDKSPSGYTGVDNGCTVIDKYGAPGLGGTADLRFKGLAQLHAEDQITTEQDEKIKELLAKSGTANVDLSEYHENRLLLADVKLQTAEDKLATHDDKIDALIAGGTIPGSEGLATEAFCEKVRSGEISDTHALHQCNERADLLAAKEDAEKNRDALKAEAATQPCPKPDEKRDEDGYCPRTTKTAPVPIETDKTSCAAKGKIQAPDGSCVDRVSDTGKLIEGDKCEKDGKVGRVISEKCSVDPGTTFKTPPDDKRAPSGMMPPRGGATTPEGARSPLTGGACTPGYICQNNTIYYQSASEDASYFYCKAQPQQQCPQGSVCGRPGQNGASGAAGGAGGIAGILSGISGVLGALGGGGAGAASQNTTCVPSQNPQQQMPTMPQSGQSNPNGTGTNGQACPQPPQKPDDAQCTSGTWKPTSAQQNGCTTGWQCVPTSGTPGAAGTPPTAQISCQPKTPDEGMPINIAFSCGYSVVSEGTNFDTKGLTSGFATTSPLVAPTTGNEVTYSIRCSNAAGAFATNSCTVKVGRSSVILKVTRQTVKKSDPEPNFLGWITTGMQKCVVSIAGNDAFNNENANNTVANGTAKLPAFSDVTKPAKVDLVCLSNGGERKDASLNITVTQQ